MKTGELWQKKRKKGHLPGPLGVPGVSHSIDPIGKA